MKLFPILLIVLFFSPTPTHARSTTYIGNYEVTTEDNGVKKETVRVAGAMGKVVKSRVTGKPWDYAYYTTDIQGSTRQELSESVIASAATQSIPKPNTYYAYGTPTNPTLNAQSQKIEDTYTGQKKDEETNLMYYNARYYNPSTGIFIQADSVDDGANKYQYVASNPINNIDPSGNGVKCIPLIMPCGKTEEEIRDEGYVDKEAENLGDSLMKAGAQIIDGLGLCITKNCKRWLSPEVYQNNQIAQMIPQPAAITGSMVTEVIRSTQTGKIIKSYAKDVRRAEYEIEGLGNLAGITDELNEASRQANRSMSWLMDLQEKIKETGVDPTMMDELNIHKELGILEHYNKQITTLGRLAGEEIRRLKVFGWDPDELNTVVDMILGGDSLFVDLVESSGDLLNK